MKINEPLVYDSYWPQIRWLSPVLCKRGPRRTDNLISKLDNYLGHLKKNDFLFDTFQKDN